MASSVEAIVFLSIIMLIIVTMISLKGARKAAKVPSILIKSLFDLLLFIGSMIVVHSMLTIILDDYIIDFTNLHMPSFILFSALTFVLWITFKMTVLSKKGGK